MIISCPELHHLQQTLKKQSNNPQLLTSCGNLCSKDLFKPPCGRSPRASIRRQSLDLVKHVKGQQFSFHDTFNVFKQWIFLLVNRWGVKHHISPLTTKLAIYIYTYICAYVEIYRLYTGCVLYCLAEGYVYIYI